MWHLSLPSSPPTHIKCTLWCRKREGRLYFIRFQLPATRRVCDELPSSVLFGHSQMRRCIPLHRPASPDSPHYSNTTTSPSTMASFAMTWPSKNGPCMTRDLQHLLDVDEERQFRCLHGSYNIPADTKKTFTSNQNTVFECKNWDNLWEQQKPEKSQTHRYKVVHILENLFLKD